jgi:hypothetical protein
MDDIDTTLAERGKEYGSFVMQAGIAQTLKKAVRACPNWPKLKADQREAVDHIMIKLSRILNGNPNHADSWHDIAGYARLVEQQLSKPDAPPVVD